MHLRIFLPDALQQNKHKLFRHYCVDTPDGTGFCCCSLSLIVDFKPTLDKGV